VRHDRTPDDRGTGTGPLRSVDACAGTRSVDAIPRRPARFARAVRPARHARSDSCAGDAVRRRALAAATAPTVRTRNSLVLRRASPHGDRDPADARDGASELLPLGGTAARGGIVAHA